MEVGGRRHAPDTSPPAKRPGTQCINGWVGTRAGLDGCEKVWLQPGFDVRIMQSVASCYTDWAIPAQMTEVYEYVFFPLTAHNFRQKRRPRSHA
jgi:hypothetical protein